MYTGPLRQTNNEPQHTAITSSMNESVYFIPIYYSLLHHTTQLP